MNLLDFQEKFRDEQACRDWLAKQRWGNEECTCPHCGSKGAYKYANGKSLKCKKCRKIFSVTVGTIFEGSKIPLIKWFLAIYLAVSCKKGISSIQLSKYIKVTQKTAWFMLQRIREVMGDNQTKDVFNGICEMDETYVGGKAENMHLHRRIKAKGVYEKSVVFGMLERGGCVRAKVVKDATAKTLLPEIYNNIEEDSLLITDEHQTYKSIGHSYVHRTVNHSAGNYVNKLEDHNGKTKLKLYTNTIEGFWSQMKRGIYGIYHWTSKKHLQKYINEFSFRYNLRRLNDFDKFNIFLESSNDKRLKYNNLVA